MNVYEAIMKRRTIRKFTQEEIPHDTLIKLIDCARVAAYGANIQPLKFMIVTDKEQLKEIFPFTKWAGYLADGAPEEDERPTAYIAVLGDGEIRPNRSYEVEAGAAVTTMMLQAVEEGLGTCWLGALERNGIKEVLGLGERYDLVYMLALGYPNQESRMVEMKDQNVKYYESEDGTINVPKRSLEEIIVK